eukprot:TRINITY_DN27323_c0_g1_i1.p1 TRINITY_DN27323_c0_g1~~TRINITY_DN27323_c0_g1_i1.p1  ORF type:complete len:497 (+),score=124.11 TRINITY_DN27323_c0_g1_i1:29-1492(+)
MSRVLQRAVLRQARGYSGWWNRKTAPPKAEGAKVAVKEAEREVEAEPVQGVSTVVASTQDGVQGAKEEHKDVGSHADGKGPMFAPEPSSRSELEPHPAKVAAPRPFRMHIEYREDPVISFVQQGRELLQGIDDGGRVATIGQTGVDGIWCIQLENLRQGNAITGEMMMQLEESMRMVNRAIKTNHEIMGLVIRGSGLNFSYGTSESISKEMTTGEEALIISRYMSSILLELQSLPVVTIAALEGVTAGSAAEIALACDFRIAAEDSMFQFSDTMNGLTPGFGGASRLADITSPRAALLLTASGKPVDPEEALELGLVDCITKPGATYNEAIKFFESNLHDHSGLGGQFGEKTWRRHSVRRMKDNVVASSVYSHFAAQETEARNFQSTWNINAKVMTERRAQATGLMRASINTALEDWATLTDPFAMSLPLHEDVGKGLTPASSDNLIGRASNSVEHAFTALFERKANQPLLNSPQSESFMKHKYVPE